MRTTIVLIAGAAAITLSACQPVIGASPASPTGATSSSAAPITPAGNGVAELSAREIATRAARAIDTNSSVRIRGTVPGNPTIVFDVRKQNLYDAEAELLIGSHPVHVIRLDRYDYVKAGASFWKELGPLAFRNDTAASRAGGKYVRAPMFSDALAPMTRTLDLSGYAWESLRENEAVKGDPAVVNGVPTIVIRVAGLGIVHVATVGQPYVIRILSFDETTVIDFTEYLEPVQVVAPPADQIIDIEDLT